MHFAIGVGAGLLLLLGGGFGALHIKKANLCAHGQERADYHAQDHGGGQCAFQEAALPVVDDQRGQGQERQGGQDGLPTGERGRQARTNAGKVAGAC